MVNRRGALREAWEESLVRAMGPVPMSSLLKQKDHHDLCWVKPLRLELESGIPRDRMLPQPAGHVWWGGEREVIHGIGAQAAGPCSRNMGIVFKTTTSMIVEGPEVTYDVLILKNFGRFKGVCYMTYRPTSQSRRRRSRECGQQGFRPRSIWSP